MCVFYSFFNCISAQNSWAHHKDTFLFGFISFAESTKYSQFVKSIFVIWIAFKTSDSCKERRKIMLHSFKVQCLVGGWTILREFRVSRCARVLISLNELDKSSLLYNKPISHMLKLHEWSLICQSRVSVVSVDSQIMADTERASKIANDKSPTYTSLTVDMSVKKFYSFSSECDLFSVVI